MKDVSADESEGALEIQRTHNLAPQHGGLEIGRMGIDQIDHQVCHFFTMSVPGCIVGQHRGDMLAKQARHVLACWRQAFVQCRGYEHLNDGPLGPAAGPRVEIGLIHIRETRGHDDAGRVMIRSCARR